MLPLRSNRKPQLLPIKQLLMKQREDINFNTEDDVPHSNTDDYLLWKSENESSGRKSVSFNIRNNESRSALRTRDVDSAHHDISQSQRTKHDIFLNDTLWDSDVDDSLHDPLSLSNRLKDFEDYNSQRQGEQIGFKSNENSVKARRQRRSGIANANNWRTENELTRKLIETLHLTIKETIDDVEHNLSSQLESKIIEEVSHLKSSLKLDSIIEMNEKVQSMYQTLKEFQQNHHCDLDSLKSTLSEELNSMSATIKSKPDNYQVDEEQIRLHLTENLKMFEKNLQEQIFSLNVKNQTESDPDQYKIMLDQSQTKMEELNKRIQSLSDEMKSIVQAVSDLKQNNTEEVTNKPSKRILNKDIMYKIDNTSNLYTYQDECDSFYKNINAELNQYRHVYINDYRARFLKGTNMVHNN